MTTTIPAVNHIPMATPMRATPMNTVILMRGIPMITGIPMAVK